MLDFICALYRSEIWLLKGRLYYSSNIFLTISGHFVILTYIMRKSLFQPFSYVFTKWDLSSLHSMEGKKIFMSHCLTSIDTNCGLTDLLINPSGF